MPHDNSVFHQLTKFIPWSVFDKSVERHKGDHRARGCFMKDQFLALLFGQFAGERSLRGTTEALSSHAPRLYHVGTKAIARSTLSDANRRRPVAVYQELFAHMVGQANRRDRRHLSEAVRLIDATKIALSGKGTEWARFSDKHKAVKLHLVYDPLADLPIEADVTADNVNDITPAKSFTLEPGVTYVFDKAYYSFEWWARMNEAGCRFVTRAKRNSCLFDVRDQPLEVASPILADRIGHPSGRIAGRTRSARINSFKDPLREITVLHEGGEPLRLLTNDLDSPPEEIAALYKARWQIELLFRWVKQNLKIRHLIGRNENAVKIQLYIALIAYLILRLAKAAQKAIARPITFARLVRQNIFHKRALTDLRGPPEQPSSNQQILLALC